MTDRNWASKYWNRSRYHYHKDSDVAGWIVRDTVVERIVALGLSKRFAAAYANELNQDYESTYVVSRSTF
jgi:hypothetical protein